MEKGIIGHLADRGFTCYSRQEDINQESSLLDIGKGNSDDLLFSGELTDIDAIVGVFNQAERARNVKITKETMNRFVRSYNRYEKLAENQATILAQRAIENAKVAADVRAVLLEGDNTPGVMVQSTETGVFITYRGHRSKVLQNKKRKDKFGEFAIVGFNKKMVMVEDYASYVTSLLSLREIWVTPVDFYSE